MIYDRATVLGLKLRSHMELPRMTRLEMLRRAGVIDNRKLEPIIDEAFKKSESLRHRQQMDDDPHGHPWHVSFHASQFPGDDPMACPRAALYQMMDFIKKPFNRHGRQVMAEGKAIEEEIVWACHHAGILISAPPDDEHQTGFEDPEHWLTGSVDSVILPKGSNTPTPVEIKSKSMADLIAMHEGEKGPDPAHVAQLKTQIAMVRAGQDEMWPDLDLKPCRGGYIYYVSRDPKFMGKQNTYEFWFDYDENFHKAGLARLKEWRGMFLEDMLPVGPEATKKHPMGWKWSEIPCKWCDYKKICQEDHKNGTADLTHSAGVEDTQAIRHKYKPEDARKRVDKRWKTQAKGKAKK